MFDWHISLAGGSVAESRGGVAKGSGGSGAENVENKQGELTAGARIAAQLMAMVMAALSAALNAVMYLRLVGAPQRLGEVFD